MGKRDKTKANGGARNPDRVNGKAWKRSHTSSIMPEIVKQSLEGSQRALSVRSSKKVHARKASRNRQEMG